MLASRQHRFLAGPTKHLKQPEQQIHKKVCAYLRKEYPHVIFRTDGAGLHLSITQATTFKSMQSCGGWPDLQILAPRKGYHGMFLELKDEGTAIYLKKPGTDGQRVLVADLHIREQASTIRRLNKEGWFARFAVGYDAAVRFIDWYFDKPQTKTMF